MSRKNGVKYIFRGTTVGWPGNPASQQLPRTPTTTNPVKALLFALCCRNKSQPAVIYFVQVSKLKGIKKDKNVLAVVEEEEGYIIAPLDFISLCDGYIPATDAIEILSDLDIKLPILFDRSQLDMALKDTPSIDENVIEKFYKIALSYFQKT